MDGPGPAIDWAVEASRPLTSRFHAAGHSLYLVGGVVRDHFLADRPPDPDLDCTTDATPDEIKTIVADVADAHWTQGEEFGTIGCRVGPWTFEITTHRADAYEPDSRKPTVAFGDDIEADLARRDFTVNAMAVDLRDGDLIDPFRGRSDLVAGILRTPLDPEISFSEDPLRMLRAARFVAGYGLEARPELADAVATMTDRLDIVSTERVRDELEKLLLLPEPARGFDFLVGTGLWGRVLPGFDPASAPVLAARVAAVIENRAERWGALVSLDGVARLRSLRLSNALIREVKWLIAVDARLTDAQPQDDRDLRAVGELVPSGERLERGVKFARDLRAADGDDPGSLADLEERVADLRRREPDFDDPGLPVDGDQVMEILGIESGPEVGRAIERLRRHRLEDGPLTIERATEILAEFSRD